jgi:2'-hydroxyisoflavone reductase
VQFIDARDLAEFSIRVCENETMGVFNVTGPKTRLSMAEMLGGIRATMSTDAWLTWVTADFLNAQRVRPWSHMPVWIPPVGQSAGFTSRSIAKAVAAGLTFRPLADTVKATLEFYNAQPEARKAELRSGLPAAREKEVLAAWHARAKTPGG